MSEIKRVALTTFVPPNVSDKVNKKSCKTVRISVILPESNEDNCPEYNYKDQLAAVKKRLKQGKDSNPAENGLDPFADDDDDVRRIALEMEAKYGSGMSSAGKKKRKGRKDDYADIGMGYDESDSFIDNTDGYDEIIPQNVTTLHGGFYINCGALEFKTDDEASSDISSSSSESEDENRPSVNRKRILDTSEESESDTANTSQTEKKPKLQSSKNTMQQAIKKKLFSQNKIQVKKRRLIDPLKKTVKELLREKREDLNLTLPLELQDDKEDNLEKDSLKENKKPMNITSVTDAIESVVKQVGEADYSNQNKQSTMDVNKKNETIVPKSVDIPSSVEGGESSQEASKLEKSDVKLPENLPADILDLINRIKQAALEYKGEGKKRFFSDEVNSMLLNLERKCKILGKSSRVRIYDHLSLFTKVRKETLSRRAKNLVLEDDEGKLQRLKVKLKDNIDQIMPSLMMNFEQESQRILQKKFSKESAESEENKALKMPRRRFKWTDESKKLLKDILSVKKRCLLLEGKQKDNLEDQIGQYLKTAILPLWPEGWMHLNALKKVYTNTTETAKMIDNNNSKNNSTTKQPSGITITPVSNNKSPVKTDVIPNNVTFSKVGASEINTKVPDAVPTTSHLSSFNINSIIKSQLQMPSVAPPNRELEKPRYEKEPDYKKPVTPPESYKFSREAGEFSKTVATHPDSGVIIKNSRKEEIAGYNSPPKENHKELNAVISKAPHCQLIDLTDAPEVKRKPKFEEINPFKYVKEPPVANSSNSNDDYTDVKKISSKHPELSLTPAFLSGSGQKPSSKSDGDDIQMVMENLKALQKLSSPVKAENPTSSPVSVIAYNRSYSPKSNSSQSSPGHRAEFNAKTDFSSSFQDEFQKQFINSLQQMATASNSNKSSYNRCS